MLFACLAFPGFRASRAIKDFSYPACRAVATSASFSVLISFSFASRASAMSSRIFLLSCEEMACRTRYYCVMMLLNYNA